MSMPTPPRTTPPAAIPPLNIGLVARCLNTEHIRGMGKYVYELLDHARAEPGLHWRLFGDDHRHPMLSPPGADQHSDVFTFRGDRFHAWEQLGVPLRMRRLPLDVLHCTEGSLPLWQPKPTIVTLHDTLAWEERPDTLGARTYYDHLLPAALKACAAVITISDTSRDDILARFPWLENKLTVILHGIDAAYFEPEHSVVPAALATALAGAPYAVYVGGPMSRKRATWAIEVLAASPRADLKLVLCGFGSAARQAAAAAVPEHVRGRVLFAEFLADAELRALYRGARAVLYPTLYEGFGFPAVEAQAAGTPVLFSALGSLRELIGPLALMVPPHDLGAWSAALEQACALADGDGAARATLAQAALAWARRFTWADSYARHLAVYRQVAGHAAASR